MSIFLLLLSEKSKILGQIGGLRIFKGYQDKRNYRFSIRYGHGRGTEHGGFSEYSLVCLNWSNPEFYSVLYVDLVMTAFRRFVNLIPNV